MIVRPDLNNLVLLVEVLAEPPAPPLPFPPRLDRSAPARSTNVDREANKPHGTAGGANDTGAASPGTTGAGQGAGAASSGNSAGGMNPAVDKNMDPKNMDPKKKR